MSPARCQLGLRDWAMGGWHPLPLSLLIPWGGGLLGSAGRGCSSVSFCALPPLLWLTCSDMWMAPRSPQSLPWSPGTASPPALPTPAPTLVLRLDDRAASLPSPFLSPHPEQHKPQQPDPKIAWNPSLLSIPRVFALRQPLFPPDSTASCGNGHLDSIHTHLSDHTLSYLKLLKMTIPF